MNSRVNLTITGEVSACTRPDVGREIRLKAARGGMPLVPADYVVALIILSQDQDSEVKSSAIRTLRSLPESTLLEIATASSTHPRVLDILGRLHFAKQNITEVLHTNPNILESTRLFLQEKAPSAVQTTCVEETEIPMAPGLPEPGSEELDDGEDAEVDEDSQEFKSKYQLAQSMGVGEKIKVALTGDKEWRTLLIKDSNKLVSGAVVKNPRITEGEILTISKSVIQNEEILRVICMNKEWIKNYQIRKALALNNKTPLPNALRYLSTLTEKDLASIAKSKNISSVIATQARRYLAAKSKH